MKSAGSLFVRFLTLGLLALVILIFGSKTFGAASVVPIAAGIILATLFVVGMYTIAVLRDDALLLEPDAPDLAYYLGFSLTVAALALTFLSDLMLEQTHGDQGQIAAAKGQVINRALSQFGAGLLATLFGLCAKILLASKQSTRAQDPTAVANKFRLELAEFSRLIDSTSQELASSVRNGCETINTASARASESIGSLAKQITASSEVLSVSFNAERMGNPIAAFLKEVEGIAAPLASLRAGVGQVNAEIERLGGSVAAYDTALKAATSSIEIHTANVVRGANDTKTLTKALGGLSKQTAVLEVAVTSAASSVDTFASPVAQLAPTLESTAGAAARLTQVSVTLADALTASERAVVSQSEQLSRLSGATLGADTALQTLNAKAGELTTSLLEGQKSVSNWTGGLIAARESIVGAGDAASGLGTALRVTADSHRTTDEVLRVSASSISAFNGLLTELSAELKRVSNVLEQSQAAAQGLNLRLGPLADTAGRTEPPLAALRTSLDATKTALASLNSSADELSVRLKVLGSNIERG